MDKVLKQRLVGASILIALAVIFLPMLFDDAGDELSEQRARQLDMPERGEGDRRVSRRLSLEPGEARGPRDDGPDAASDPVEPTPQPDSRSPAGPDDGGEPDDAVVAEPIEPAPESEPEPDDASRDDARQDSAQEPEESPETDSDPPEAPEPEASETAESREAEPRPDSEIPDEPAQDAAVGGRWVVQVAVFSSRETARRIQDRLDELGHRVTLDVMVRDQSELFRLRTGPYGDEAAAEQARGQIGATIAGVEPAVRELDGVGGDDRSGLAVQVGSFASLNNAERLVARLKSEDFDAFMHGEESGGRTIWRVRVGTHEERSDAEQLLETLRDQQGLEGIVVSHP